jgi:acyl carrier protein
MKIYTKREAWHLFTRVLIDELVLAPEQVVETARFDEDLDADSLDFVETIMALQEAFDIDIDETARGQFTTNPDLATVGGAFDLVCRHLNILQFV